MSVKTVTLKAFLSQNFFRPPSHDFSLATRGRRENGNDVLFPDRSFQIDKVMPIQFDNDMGIDLTIL